MICKEKKSTFVNVSPSQCDKCMQNCKLMICAKVRKCTCIKMKAAKVWEQNKEINQSPLFTHPGTYPLFHYSPSWWIMPVIYRIGHMTNVAETHGSAFGLFQPEHFSLVNVKKHQFLVSRGGKRRQRQEVKVMMGKAFNMIISLFPLSGQSDNAHLLLQSSKCSLVRLQIKRIHQKSMPCVISPIWNDVISNAESFKIIVSIIWEEWYKQCLSI